MEQKFRILIVDDKELDRNGVCYLIEQNALPLLPTTAASAQEALEILRRENFDIMLTDIKMPEMSGLELIKAAQDIQPAMKSVVFSSYDNFHYAQSAMDVGVTKYLLKPIKIDRFVKCLNGLLDEIREQSTDRDVHRIYDLISNVAVSANSTEMHGYAFLLDFIHPFFNKPDFENFLPKLPKQILQIPINEYQCLFVTHHEADAQIYIDELKKHLQNCDNLCLITYGGLFETTEQLQAVFREMEQCSTAKFYIKENETVYLNNQTTNSIKPDAQSIWSTCDKIAKHALRREFDVADDLLDKLFSELQLNRGIPITIIKSACAEIARVCLLNNDEHQGNFVEALLKIDQNTNIEELKGTVSEMIHLSAGDTAETLAIQRALEIIHQKYMDDIGLESLAAEVYLSSCYFSYLFKKTTGVSFLKYLTTYRVEKAKDLLRTTQLRIGEICERVGYSNRSYFCQIFRNYCGMSPMQYREMK